MMNFVNNALENNLNKNTYNKDFSSLNQGLEMLTERENYLKKISKKQNIIEGNTSRESSTLKIDNLKKDYENQKKTFNETLSTYKTNYEEFIRKFEKVEKEVRDCKINNCESTYNVVEGDTDEEIKKKQERKRACKAGCHFNLPVILDCKENEIFTKDPQNRTCSDLREQCIMGNRKDTQGRNTQTELLGIVDENKVSAWEGCCDCNLNKKYVPYYMSKGKKYMRCNDFRGENEQGTANDELVKACENGENGANISVQSSYFKTTYKNLKNKNDSLIKKSNDILKIVEDLNDLNVELLGKKQSNVEKIQEDSLALEKINQDIINLQNKTKNNTLNKHLSDKYMLKKSTDLRLYVWGILAFGFGLTAIIKINKL